MCGIVGIIGNFKPKLTIECLKQLQNRGYDSAGISILEQNSGLTTFKEINKESINVLLYKTQNLKKDYYNCISHTRWATHGGITQDNCHPHLSNDCKINLVHNGIIENYQEVKDLLIKNGFTFYSDTDSEVIVNLIEYNYGNSNNNNNNSLLDNFKLSIEKSINYLNGTWALLIQHTEIPDTIFAIKRGSPLVMGINNNLKIITSEISGFNNLLFEYSELESDKLYIISNNNNIQLSFNLKINKCNNENIGSFEHWTLKEINDQKRLISNITNNGSRIKENRVIFGGLEKYKNLMQNCDNLLLFGCGTSYNSCLYAKHYIQNITHFKNILCFDACNFNFDSIPKNSKNCCLFVSQSGETKDLFEILNNIKKERKSEINIGIINVVDSLIARTVDCGIYLNMNKEVSVASTKIFTAQCLTLILFGIYLCENQITCNNYINNIRNLEKLIIDEVDSEINNDNLDKLFKSNNGFIIGDSELYPIALEASLKFKEITYLHIEALTSKSLKHGPLALVSENNFINILLLDNPSSCKQEILARDGKIIEIGNASNASNASNANNNNYKNLFSSLLYNIKLEKICYYLSIKKGINPDFPRNLAKVVTV